MKPEKKKDQESSNGDDPSPHPVGEDNHSSREAEELRVQLEEALKTVAATKDQLLRKAAEFENYKRRTETEYLNVIRNANEALLLSLLPVVSDFRRSLKAGREQPENDSFYKGVELIFQKLMRTLESHGVQQFTSAGKPFDVEYHDALMQVPRGDIPPNTVVDEVEPGFMLHNKVLQHAKVVVSSAPVADGENIAPDTTTEPVKQ